MESQNKIKRGRALDLPEFKRGGWILIPHKAFKRTDPEILSKMNPLPPINR